MQLTKKTPTATRMGLLLAVSCLVVACGSSGRNMREPEPNAVSPTRSVTTTVPVTSPGSLGTLPPALGISSSAFLPGEAIPVEFSCNGPSPPLSWTVPFFAPAELAVVVDDPQAQGFVHWIVVGISPKSGSVAQGGVPEGGRQLANSAGKETWFGPCPPAGRPHTYNITIYGLASPATIAPGTPARQAADQLRAVAGTANATITGTFQR